MSSLTTAQTARTVPENCPPGLAPSYLQVAFMCAPADSRDPLETAVFAQSTEESTVLQEFFYPRPGT